MMVKLRCCFAFLVLFAVLVAGLSSCAEDCAETYQVCLNKIEGSMAKFDYNTTCRYPSMNRGDAKIFCDCEDDYRDCGGK